MPSNNPSHRGQRTSQFFDGYAHDFDAIYGRGKGPVNRIVSRVFRRSMRMRYEKTLAACDPAKGQSVLDIGCGPGHYSLALARKGLGPIIGLDFAAEMIQLASTRADELGLSEKVVFTQADFLTCQFDRQFDFVVCMGVMDYIREPLEFLQKAIGLTRVKAVFSFPVAEGFLAWQRKIRYKTRCDLYLYNKREVEQLMNWFSHESIVVEKISRDYFVTVEK